MSKNKQFVLVSPPMFLHESMNEERMVSTGHVCSCCGGNGWFWDQSGRDAYKKSCPVCMGSGKLDAEITIKWVPSGK